MTSNQGAVTGTGTTFQTTKPFKAAVAVVGGLVLALVAALSDDNITPAEWVQIVVAGATAFSIWSTANLPGFIYGKGIVAVVGAVANLICSYATGQDITNNEWLNLAVIALTSLGVIAVPNPVATRSTRRIK